MIMEVGSIVWARLASFPYWPAMVYPEITDAPYNGIHSFTHSQCAFLSISAD